MPLIRTLMFDVRGWLSLVESAVGWGGTDGFVVFTIEQVELRSMFIVLRVEEKHMNSIRNEY